MLTRSITILAASLLVSVSAGAAQLVTNGDFATPNTNGGYGIFSPAQSGWTNLTDSGVEIGASTIYGVPCASAGCQSLEVNANTFGDVVQTINGLTAGDKYILSYSYGGRPGGGVQVLDVNFGGGLVSTDTGSYGVFTPYHFIVTATGPSEVIEFKSEATSGLPSYGNEITNVSLTAVPEAATWTMLIAGFALVGVAARRRIAHAA